MEHWWNDKAGERPKFAGGGQNFRTATLPTTNLAKNEELTTNPLSHGMALGYATRDLTVCKDAFVPHIEHIILPLVKLKLLL